MKFKKLCDFTTIDNEKRIKFIDNKYVVEKVDSINEENVKDNNKNNEENVKDNNKIVASLLNNVKDSLDNRSFWEKAKRIFSVFFGKRIKRGRSYNEQLKNKIEGVRELCKLVLRGNSNIDLCEDSIDTNNTCDQSAQEKSSGEFTTAFDLPCLKDGNIYTIYTKTINKIFKEYSSYIKGIKMTIADLKEKLNINYKENQKTADFDKAIKILEDCLLRGIDPKIDTTSNDLINKIINSNLPLARTYKVLERISDFNEEEKGKIIQVDIPFYKEEVNAFCKVFNGQEKVSIADLAEKTGPTNKENIDEKDREELKKLHKKLNACKAALSLKNKGQGESKVDEVSNDEEKCKVDEVSNDEEKCKVDEASNDEEKYEVDEALNDEEKCKVGQALNDEENCKVGQALLTVKKYIEEEKEQKPRNAIARIANNNIKSKQNKIFLKAFIVSLIIIMLTTVFSFFKAPIKYDLGKEITTVLEGNEYTYKKIEGNDAIILSATINNINNYNIEDGEIIREQKNYYKIPQTLDGHNVVAIDSYAFVENDNLEIVVIGNNIKAIGKEAFARSENSITIYCEAETMPDEWDKSWANSNTVKWNYGNIQEDITIIEVTIGELRYSLRKNNELEFAVVEGFSESYTNQSELTIAENIEFEGKLYKVCQIGDNAFSECDRLEKISIPNSITKIGEGSFYGCSSLTEVVVPDCVKKIGKGCFEKCSKLTSITLPFVGEQIDGIENTFLGYIFGADGSKNNADNLPESLTTVIVSQGTITGNSFYNCSNLQSIEIGTEVDSIEYNALAGCTGLEKLTLPFVGEQIDGTENTFLGYIFGAGTYKSNNSVVPKNLETLTITGNGNIDSYAFYACENLKTVDISRAVCVGDNVFEDCTDLKNVYFADNINRLGNDVFKRCDNIIFTEDTCGVKYIGNENNNWRILFDASNCKAIDYTVNIDTKIIADKAFNTNKFLQSINVSDNLKMIGNGAFANCTSLTEIVLPNNLLTINENAFYGCSSLVKLELPSSVEKISKNSFNGCSALDTILVKEGNANYQSINNCLIELSTKTLILGCKNSIIPEVDYVETIGEFAFSKTALNKIIIPDNITRIESGAFEGCSSLTVISMSANVFEVGTDAFKDCNAITDATIPSIAISCIPKSSLQNVEVNGGEEIPENAFKDCTELKSVLIEDSVAKIGLGAFIGCIKLTDIKLSDSILNIENNSFYNCNSLIDVTYSGNISDWCKISFANEYANPMNYATNLYINNQKISGDIILEESVSKIPANTFKNSEITSISIPSGVKSIEDSTFYFCDSLTSVIIPSSVTSIASNAFEGCNSIVDITMPTIAIDYINNDNLQNLVINGGEEIPDYAFAESIYLENVTIGESVTTLGQYAFSGCVNIENLVIPDNVIMIGEGLLNGCSNLQSLTIPFVGDRAGVTSSDTYQYPFGYIFGTSVYDGGVETKQWYYSNILDIYVSISFYIPVSLKNVKVTGKNILDAVFYNCNGLTSITISDRVTIIEDLAFYNCSSLTSITITASVTKIGESAFAGCSSLTSVIIPSSVTSIASNAFEGCNSIVNITMPTIAIDYINNDNLQNLVINGGEEIPDYAFADSIYLENVTIGESVTTLGQYAFSGCVNIENLVIPDNVIRIGEGLLNGCSNLQSLTIPFVGDRAGVTSSDTYQYPFGYIFGTSAYDGGKETVQYYHGSTSSSITSSTYYIPSSLKSITVICGDILFGAFHNCRNLTSITIPDSIKSIGDKAFVGCSSLMSITIPDSVTRIGYGAFYRCSSLTSITIPDGVTSIGDWEFNDCSSLTSITIPDGVTSIGDFAFDGCSSLTSITIPGSVMSIGDRAFVGCSSLMSITIPDSVTRIGYGAFYRCSSLTSITIPFVGEEADGTGNTYLGYIFGASSYTNNSSYVPESLREVIITGGTIIGDFAFDSCDRLTSITIPDSVAIIGEEAFRRCIKLSIYCEAVSQPSGWDSSWNSENCPVIWDCNNNDLDENGYKYIQVNGLNYAIKDGYAKVVGNNVSDNITIPSCIQYKNNLYRITSIGYRAFYKCSSLTSVTIGDSLTSIEESAFAGCFSLTNITIPDNVTNIGDYAFAACSSLTSITIPESVTSIGDWVFDHCSLTSIIISNSVQSIGLGAFTNCDSLTSVIFENPNNWEVSMNSSFTNVDLISSLDLKDEEKAARYLTDEYSWHYWRRTA